jgi:hypothetical protein
LTPPLTLDKFLAPDIPQPIRRRSLSSRLLDHPRLLCVDAVLDTYSPYQTATGKDSVKVALGSTSLIQVGVVDSKYKFGGAL